MGMYNEVYAPCLHCGSRCYKQISQITLGFGGFDLSEPITTDGLSYEEKLALKKAVEREKFYCEEHGWFQVTIVVTKTKHKVFEI